MRKVYIEWSDSNIYHGQFAKDEDFEFANITTTGFLLKKTKNEIVVARDEVATTNMTEYRDIIVIPKVNINGIYNLE